MNSHIALLDQAFPAMRSNIYKAVLRIVQDRAVAEELTQEAYLRARSTVEHDVPKNMEALLWQIARNLAFDHLRWKKVRGGTKALDALQANDASLADCKPSAEEQVIYKDELRIVTEALHKLPLRTQKAWVLNRVEGWSYPRIAEHLGVSPNTVFNDIKTAMGMLHDLRRRKIDV
jgi:RNA polymerase sigma factor (sigma-70 family)